MALVVLGKGFPKRRKYQNEPVEITGMRFASKKEADRYVNLISAQRLRIIYGLKVHPQWKIVINGMFICTYTADFSYWHRETGVFHVEDVKGYRTREYQRVKRLMKAVHGIDIEEI